MPLPRFYCQNSIADAVQVRLATRAAHHAATVLRLKRGDECVLFDGSGGEYAATIHEVGRTAVIVDVGKWQSLDRASGVRICLAQGLASGDKMDTILQQAVQLGVAVFQPLATRKSIVRLTDERALRRLQHWREIAIAACEQCGLNRVPEVMPVESFDDWVTGASGVRLLLAPEATLALAELPPPIESVTVLAGPESGFLDSEVEQALQAGFRALRLGPRVLRTETAGLAALAAMQTLWGDY